MKIHSFGNDYAFQQRLKKESEENKSVQPVDKPQTNLPDIVEHQVQTGGEAEVGATDSETCTDTEAPFAPEETKKTSKKKKAKRAEAE